MSGNINILQVSNDFNNTLKVSNLREIRFDADYSQPDTRSSVSQFSSIFKQFFTTKPQPSAVNGIKYLKDNLLCYITEDGKFKIFNQQTNREVYCNETVLAFMNSGSNNYQEKILKCKIEFLDYDASRNFFLETSSKILFFCVYVEYANSQFLKIFELQFLDIPLANEIINIDVNNLISLKDYGSTVILNNSKVVKLSGKLVDLKTIKDKFWSIAHKRSLESDPGSEDPLFGKYEIKIFNTFKLPNENQSDLKNYYNNNYYNHNLNSSEQANIRNNQNIIVNDYNDNFEISAANNDFFNHTNQEVILLDHKLKNFALTVTQLSLIKNETIRNRSLYRLLEGAERIISNEQLMNFNRKLSEKNSSRLTSNNPSTTQSRNFMRECETQKELVNRSAILNRIFRSSGCASGESFNSNSLLDFIQALIFESFSNQIISLGHILNRNLDSICVLRENGIGFLRDVAEFQKVNEAIGVHESNLRGIVFGAKSFGKSSAGLFRTEINSKRETQSVSAVSREIKLMQSNILSYASEQSQVSEENQLFVCLALLRILLVDNFINLEDYNCFVDFFNVGDNNNRNFKDFVAELFGEKLQKENNMLFLDVFNSLISKIFKSNVSSQLKSFQDLLLKFAEYQSGDLARKIGKFSEEQNSIGGGVNMNKNGGSFVSAGAADKYDFKFNYKLCEIIKKITQDKIEALFNLSRDLVALSKWVETYYYPLVSTKADKFEQSGNK